MLGAGPAVTVDAVVLKGDEVVDTTDTTLSSAVAAVAAISWGSSKVSPRATDGRTHEILYRKRMSLTSNLLQDQQAIKQYE